MKAKKKLLRTIALLLVSVMLFQNGLSSAYAMENQLVGSTDGNLEPVNLGDGQDGVDPNGNNAQPVNTQDGSDNNSSTKAGNESNPVVGEDDGKSTPTGGDDASTNPTGEGENESTPTGGKDASAAPTGEGENESTPTGGNDASTAPTGEGENESTPTGGSDASAAPTGEGEDESTSTGENDASTSTGEEDSQEPEGNAEPLMMKRSMARGVQPKAGTTGEIKQWGPDEGPTDKEGTHAIIGWYEKNTEDKKDRPDYVEVIVNWEDVSGTILTGKITLWSEEKKNNESTHTAVGTMQRDLSEYGASGTINIDRWKTWPYYAAGSIDSNENRSVTYVFPDIDGYVKRIDGDCGVIYIKSDTKPQPDDKGKIIIKKETVVPEGQTITTPDETVFKVTNFDTKEVTTVYYKDFTYDGEYMSYTLENMPLGSYTITESGAEQEGYILTIKGSKAGHNDKNDPNNYETNSGPEASVIINKLGGQDIAYITNTYELAGTDIQLHAKKSLNGRELEENEFEFEIKRGKSVIATAKNKADGTIEFPKMYYNQEGKYNYTISEVKGDSPNIKYDEKSYKVTVKVEKNNDGTLKATADYGETGEIEFKNYYTLIDISVRKIWDDNDNQDGKRPESITVNLLVNGDSVDSTTVSADDNWEYSFTNLPKYENGQEIVYTVSENEVAGYQSEISGDATAGFIIKNSYTPEKTSVSGTKTWDDNNNQAGKRPESITINLLADGKEVKKQTVKADKKGKWSYSFTDLDKYKAGEEIKYTITEDPVEGYTTTIAGYNVTNSYIPEKPGNPQDGDKPMNPGTKPSGDKPTNPDKKPSGDKTTNPDTKPSGDKTTNANTKPSGNKPTVDSATTSVKSVRTGDNSAIGFWLASTAALAVVLCVLLRKKLNR